MYHWIKVFDSLIAMENNLPKGKSEVFLLKGEKVCLVHGTDGFYAVQDKCPHNGASLSSGFCSEKNEIVCPIHRYKFDLKTGKATSGAGYALNTFPISIKETGIYVGIKAKWWEM